MIDSIDHIVLTIKDLNKTINFYCNILGMKLEEFKVNNNSEIRKCLKFGNQKINLHEFNNLFKPGAKIPRPGTGDICFISDIDVLEWEKIFIKNSINIELGPTKQIGAEGYLFSIYIRDPDENLIEIANRIKL
jgi:catechol 2,3-dioxygenase-like lactoylglutathione lyase family enzyme